MSLFFIKNHTEKKLLAMPGLKSTFTSDLSDAQTFDSYEKAQKVCCADEAPVAVESQLQKPMEYFW